MTKRSNDIRRYWEELSRLDPDISIIDPNDGRGEKNRYLAWLRDRAFTEALARANIDTGDAPGVLLDYGCGSGSASLPLLRRGYHVVGVDISQGLLAQARTRCADHPAVFLRADGFTLPVMPASIDAALTYGVLIYLTNDDDARHLLSQIRVSLKPGGFVVLIEQARRRRRMSEDGLKVFRTQAEWQLLLESAGFRVERTMILRSGRFPTTPMIRAGWVPRTLWPMIATLERAVTKLIGVPPWDYVDVILEARS